MRGPPWSYIFRLSYRKLLTAHLILQNMLALANPARLLASSGTDPAVLRQNVTSPGGTTAAGLAVFEEANYRDLMAAVVRAATERSRQLGAS